MKDSFNTSLPLKLRTFLVCLWWRRRERGCIFACVIVWVWYYMSHRLLKPWDNYNHVSLPCVVKCSFYPVLVLPQMIRDKKMKMTEICLNDSWLWALTLFNFYLYTISSNLIFTLEVTDTFVCSFLYLLYLSESYHLF